MSVPSFKTATSISDLHIFDDSRFQKLTFLFEAVAEDDPDLLVLNGDIGDPWQASWRQILTTLSWGRLSALVERRQQQRKISIYLCDNHDHDAKARYLPSATLVRSYHAEIAGAEYLFRHGWEYSISWAGIFGLPGISPAAFWISKHAPWLMVPIYNLLFKRKTPGTKKAQGKIDEWTLEIESVNALARKEAHKQQEMVIFGHTHYPLVEKWIANDGDGTNDFSRIHISPSGVELRYLDGRVIKMEEECDGRP